LFADEVDFFGVVADLVLGQGMVEMLDGAAPGTRERGWRRRLFLYV
jgi:hypothetical protein